MTYFAIQRKKDKAFVSGTDYRYNPPHSIMANDCSPPLLIPCDMRFVHTQIKKRKINLKKYRTVIVEITEFDTRKGE